MKKILSIGILLGCISCQPIKILEDRRSGKSSTRALETFAFSTLEKRVKVNHANSSKTEEFLYEELQNTLEDQGYIYDDEDPDFLVDMELILRNIKQNNTNNNVYSGPFRMQRFYYTGRFDQYGFYDDIRQNSYSEAKIRILVALGPENQQVYEGAARTRLGTKAKKGVSRLEMTIDKLVGNFSRTP
ncbi:MAG: DUF4136 domain-containing protein [Bacteroidota bacterium]